MGLLSRFVRVFRSKINAAISSQEDPVQNLELQFEDMKDNRDDIKEGLTNIKTEKYKAEDKIESLEEEIENHNESAREAAADGNDDLAREHLHKKKEKYEILDQLYENVSKLEKSESNMKDKLVEANENIETMRSKKEMLKARYNSAETVESAVDTTAISVNSVTTDIENEIETLEARTTAIEEINSTEKTVSEKQKDHEIEKELETLKQ